MTERTWRYGMSATVIVVSFILVLLMPGPVFTAVNGVVAGMLVAALLQGSHEPVE